MVFISSLAYGELRTDPVEAIKIAKEYSQSINPPIDLTQIKDFEAAPIQTETEYVWLVVLKRDPPSSNYMIKVDIATGKALGFVEAQKQKDYKRLFESHAM